MVSVLTTAYNHQDTIQRAIDSVRMQRGVAFEHIIIDDTERKYGMMRTFQEGFERCKGEYICVCDGDDFYIDPYKLKKQTEYMDAHPECGFTVTRVYTETNGKREGCPTAEEINHVLTFDDFLKGTSWIAAQSYCIRKSVFDEYVDFGEFVRLGFKMWDNPIILELIQHTKFHCLDFYSSVYTKNTESVTNTNQRMKRFKYRMNMYWIKLYFIWKYGCKMSTILYLLYRFVRDLYSIAFKRWT